MIMPQYRKKNMPIFFSSLIQKTRFTNFLSQSHNAHRQPNLIISLIILTTIFTLNSMESVTPEVPYLSEEIKTKISNYTIKPDWWYLAKGIKHEAGIYTITFNHSGTMLATTSCLFPQKARIFNTNSGKKVASFTYSGINCHSSSFFDPTDTFFTLVSDGKRYTFNLNTNRWKRKTDKHPNYSSYFNTSGSLVAKTTNVPNSPITIINTATNDHLSIFDHDKRIDSISFNSSGDVIAINYSDNLTTDIVNIKTKKTSRIQQHESEYGSVCFDPAGNRLTIIKNNDTIKIINIDKNSPETFLSVASNYYINAVQFNQSGNCLAIASPDKVYIFTKHITCDRAQIQLKYALLGWLLIEKPSKGLNSLKHLLADIAKKHIIIRPYHLSDGEELAEINKTWNTFPKDMQVALWRTMLYRIKKFGKK